MGEDRDKEWEKQLNELLDNLAQGKEIKSERLKVDENANVLKEKETINPVKRNITGRTSGRKIEENEKKLEIPEEEKNFWDKLIQVDNKGTIQIDGSKMQAKDLGEKHEKVINNVIMGVNKNEMATFIKVLEQKMQETGSKNISIRNMELKFVGTTQEALEEFTHILENTKQLEIQDSLVYDLPSMIGGMNGQDWRKTNRYTPINFLQYNSSNNKMQLSSADLINIEDYRPILNRNNIKQVDMLIRDEQEMKMAREVIDLSNEVVEMPGKDIKYPIMNILDQRKEKQPRKQANPIKDIVEDYHVNTPEKDKQPIKQKVVTEQQATRGNLRIPEEIEEGRIIREFVEEKENDPKIEEPKSFWNKIKDQLKKVPVLKNLWKKEEIKKLPEPKERPQTSSVNSFKRNLTEGVKVTPLTEERETEQEEEIGRIARMVDTKTGKVIRPTRGQGTER